MEPSVTLEPSVKVDRAESAEEEFILGGMPLKAASSTSISSADAEVRADRSTPQERCEPGVIIDKC